MGDTLTLDDGRYFSGSSFGISGLLWLVADHLPSEHSRLESWLRDVSERSNGFMSIDLRGIPDDSRSAFHEAAQVAYEKTIGSGQEITAQPCALMTLNRFMEAQQSILRGDPPETWAEGGTTKQAFMEDLDELRKSSD